MQLLGKPVVSKLTKETRSYLSSSIASWSYVVIFLLSDDPASEVYVSLKAKYAQKVWIYADIKFGKDRSLEEVLEEMMLANTDNLCVWIMVQLPLSEHLQKHKETILESIVPEKDIDWLWSRRFWMSWFWYSSFLWATPRAAFEILDYYDFWNLEWKVVHIINQSNLIGKWLATEVMNRWWTVISSNHLTPVSLIHDGFWACDILMTATWVKNLINLDSLSSSFTWSDDEMKESLWNKLLLDIGWWSDEAWVHGDIDEDSFWDLVQWITPVPGGVWPVTVACLFANIKEVRK